MVRSVRRHSLFSQKLDHAIFVTYFLGAVVPILALGYLTQRFALPAVEGDRAETLVLLGLTAGVAVLSLASFFALRRLSMSAVARMDADNQRLAAILKASRSLAAAPHTHAAAEAAASCSQALTAARAVFVLLRSEEGKPVTLCEAVGEGAQALYASHEEEITELVEQIGPSSGASQQRVVGTWLAAAVGLDGETGARGAIVALVDPIHAEHSGALAPAVLDAVSTLASLAGVALQSADLKDSQRNFFTHATEIIVAALDTHVPERAGQAQRVARLANRIGRELGLQDEVLRRLHFASLLKDIGRLRLDASQQRSPAHVSRHPVIGHRMLSRIRLWEPLAGIVLQQHAHYDGAGLKDVSVGEDIPLESRILHVADAFMHMRRSSEYGLAVGDSEALEEIVAGKNTQFDPKVVAGLEKIVARGEIDEE